MALGRNERQEDYVEHHVAAIEASQRLWNVEVPTALRIYACVQMASSPYSLEGLDQVVNDAKSRIKTRKQAQALVEASKVACVALFGIDDSKQEQLFELVSASIDCAQKPNVVTASRRTKALSSLISDLDELQGHNLMRMIGSIHNLNHHEPSPIFNWKDAMVAYERHPDLFGAAAV